MTTFGASQPHTHLTGGVLLESKIVAVLKEVTTTAHPDILTVLPKVAHIVLLRFRVLCGDIMSMFYAALRCGCKH